MSKAQLVITAVVREGRSKSGVAREDRQHNASADYWLARSRRFDRLRRRAERNLHHQPGSLP